MKNQAAIYARVSSAKQKVGENIQSQISCLIDYANKLNFDIPNGWIFKDEGISGATLQRPGLDALRENVHEGLIEKVLIFSPDRLSRKYAYQLILEIEFEKKGVEIIFLNTPKAQTPEEQLSLHFKSIFAEYERAQIIERCRRGRLYRAKQGSVSVIPTAPLGYDYIKKSESSLSQYVVNNDSQIVKKIFHYYVHKHLSISKICRELEKENILTPKKGIKWFTGTVRDILKNEAYIGTAYFGKTTSSEGIKGRRFRTAKGERKITATNAHKKCPKESWIPIKVPQIISESDFEIAQVKLEKNIETSSRNTKIPSLLQGILTCGYCGGSYIKKARHVKYLYYSCGQRAYGSKCVGPSIHLKELDDIVWTHVMNLLRNPQLIEEEVERRNNENPDEKNSKMKIKELDKAYVQITRSRDKLLDAYQDGECLTLEDLKGRLKALDLKLKAISREKKSIQDNTLNEDRLKNIKTHIKRFEEQLNNSENLSIIEKQNVLRMLVDEIIITGDHVEIKHCIPCHDRKISDFGQLCSDGYCNSPVATPWGQ